MFIIYWLILATAIAVLSSLYYLLTSLDDSAANEIKQRVDLALTIESRYQEKLLAEYSYWDEAHQEIIINRNEKWIAYNTGEYQLTDNFYDFTLAIENDRDLVYLTTRDDLSSLDFDELMAQGISKMIVKSNSLETVTKTTNDFISVNGEVFFVMGGPFINEETDLPRVGTYLVFAKHINDKAIEFLSKSYQLPNLELELTTDASINKKVLISPNGESIAALKWTPNSPSKKIIPTVSFVTAFFFMITLFGTRYLIKKEQSNRANYEEKLYLEATRDSLTEVNNRRHFMELGFLEFASFRSSQHPISVVILDIDYFKEINDLHGHAVGDKALVHFAKTCQAFSRKSDTFGRIGGEEFAFVFPNTTLNEAVIVANKLRVALAETPLQIDEHVIRLTVSIGVAELNKQRSFDELLHDADTALYKAKNAGRNKVVLHQ